MTPLAARSAMGAAQGLGSSSQPFNSVGSPTAGPFAVDASSQGLTDVKANIFKHSDSVNVGGRDSGYRLSSDGVLTNIAFSQRTSDKEQKALLCGGKMLPPPPLLSVPAPPPVAYQSVIVQDTSLGRTLTGDPITCTESGITLLSSCNGVAFPCDAVGVVRTYSAPAGLYSWCSTNQVPHFSAGSVSGTVPTSLLLSVNLG